MKSVTQVLDKIVSLSFCVNTIEKGMNLSVLPAAIDIFVIFSLDLEIFCQDRFQKQSLLTKLIFLKNQVIFLKKIA